MPDKNMTVQTMSNNPVDCDYHSLHFWKSEIRLLQHLRKFLRQGSVHLRPLRHPRMHPPVSGFRHPGRSLLLLKMSASLPAGLRNLHPLLRNPSPRRLLHLVHFHHHLLLRCRIRNHPQSLLPKNLPVLPVPTHLPVQKSPPGSSAASPYPLSGRSLRLLPWIFFSHTFLPHMIFIFLFFVSASFLKSPRGSAEKGFRS